MVREIPWTGLLCGLVIQLGLATQVQGQAAAAQAPAQPAGWEVLAQRPAQGEQCIVCRQSIHDGEIVEVRYKGRTFHVAVSMLETFEADPDHYFLTMQARAALFDEAAMETPAMRLGGLFFGLYVLVGLLCGAGCSYLALDHGLPGWGWFFAGLLLNVLALAAILVVRPTASGDPPQSPGLTKIPATRSPRACPACGHTDHPSAASCGSCGRTLTPAVEAETVRA